jgi:hypothetical protein
VCCNLLLWSWSLGTNEKKKRKMEVKRKGHKPCTVTSSSCCLQTKHQLFKKVRREGVSLLAYSFVACLLAGSLEQ